MRYSDFVFSFRRFFFLEVFQTAQMRIGLERDAQIIRLQALDGKQPGDPAKASKLIIEAASADAPPRRLVLGRVAIDRARQRLKDVEADIEAWEAKCAATVFD